MDLHEKAIYFAHALSNDVGRRVAVFYGNGGCQVAAVDTRVYTAQPRSALINLLRNGNCGRTGTVALSYEPDEMDRGMFQMNAPDGGMVWAAHGTIFHATAPNFGWRVQRRPSADGSVRRWLNKGDTFRARQAEHWLRGAGAGPFAGQLAGARGALVRDLTPPRFAPVPESWPSLGYHPTPLTDAIFMTLAYALVRVGWSDRGRERSEHGGHNIGCVVVDASGAIVSWGLNTNEIGTSLHGEVNAVLSYQRDGRGAFERGARIYTTLKPCHMCAATLAEAAPGCTVVVGQDDVNIKGSALDRGVNGCEQVRRPHETTGHALLALQGRQSTTGMLSTPEAREHLEDALYEFFTIGLNIRMNSREEPLWQQGLELLKQVSPHVETLRGLHLRGLEALAREREARAI